MVTTIIPCIMCLDSHCFAFCCLAGKLIGAFQKEIPKDPKTGMLGIPMDSKEGMSGPSRGSKEGIMRPPRGSKQRGLLLGILKSECAKHMEDHGSPS